MTETFTAIQPGLGCTLSYSTTSGGSFTAVAQVEDIDGISPSVGMFDATTLGSAAYEQVPTIFRTGDVPFKVKFNPSDATHTALQGYMAAYTLLYWKLTFSSPVGPGATAPESPVVYTFCGYLTGFNITGLSVQSGASADVKISVTGVLTT